MSKEGRYYLTNDIFNANAAWIPQRMLDSVAALTLELKNLVAKNGMSTQYLREELQLMNDYCNQLDTEMAFYYNKANNDLK